MRNIFPNKENIYILWLYLMKIYSKKILIIKKLIGKGRKEVKKQLAVG